jgi:hypothetical protein
MNFGTSKARCLPPCLIPAFLSILCLLPDLSVIYFVNHIFCPSRNDAPSGLLLNVAPLKGVRIHESFTPSQNNTEPVNYRTVANTIKLEPGKQAAATVGGGVTYKEFNRVLRASGLYSIGAAHGEFFLRFRSLISFIIWTAD